jgi:hypothetical protein
MRRSGKIAVLAPLLGVLIALAAPSFAAAETLSPTERRAQESLLRLSELPPGYVIGERPHCARSGAGVEEEVGGLVEEGERPPEPTGYDKFLEGNRLTTCVYPYERIYRPVGSPADPPRLDSFVMVTPSAAAAAAGLTVGDELAANVFELEGLRPGGQAPALGEGAHRFHDDQIRSGRREHLPGTVIVWRDGRTIAGILAGGGKPPLNDAAAARYAAIQQTSVETPRPFQQSEDEDIPTWLDNPRFGIPVYWLGEEFKLGRAEPSHFLRAEDRKLLEHPQTGERLSMQYEDVLSFDTWTPAGWRRFAKTGVGRRPWSWHCTRSRTIQLAHGHAVIYAAYRKDYATCPTAPPHDYFLAHAFLPGAVVTFGQPLCRLCEGELVPEFESFAGMEALVRGLRRWRPGETG